MNNEIQIDDQIDDAENTQVGQDISKADLLAKMVSDNATLEQIGSAWTLYLRLALIEGGTMTGTYDEIGQVMATSGKTIRNWVKSLEASGIVQSESKGHRVSIELMGDHMAIAQAPNSISQVEAEVMSTEVKPMRNRLLAFCLCYDFALRIGEVALLNVDDISIDEFVALNIRSKIQKGNDKPEKTSYSFFPESKTLMTAYLKLREQKHPTTDALIITEKGERMLVNGCRDSIQDLCVQLGVKTYKGSLPAPHRLRHSFPSCNVEPLGLNLDIYEIMRRLRHTSVELTTKTYITNNPLLEKAKHVAHVKAHRASTIQQNHQSRINNRHVQPHSNVMNLPRPSPALDLAQVSMPFTPSSQDFSVPENDALKMLAPFEITRQGLRKYAEGQGMGEGTDEAFYYSRQFIDALSYNYMTKQETMATIGLRKSGLHYWMSSKGIQAVVIGKTSLIRKDDVLARNKEENLKKAG